MHDTTLIFLFAVALRIFPIAVVRKPGLQQVGDLLYVQRRVSSAYFLQGVVYDAQIAAQLRNHCSYFLLIAQNFHALRVRIVTQPERFLDLLGIFSENRSETNRLSRRNP